ncbi:MAG: hypothetical protein HQM14_08130 [SAR324 cluster bacterium]|nr:hypothetical protein [SAR324 cluster bacterium]
MTIKQLKQHGRVFFLSSMIVIFFQLGVLLADDSPTFETSSEYALALELLETGDWQEIDKGFYTIVRHVSEESIKTALIDKLEEETSRHQTAGRFEDHAHMEFYMNLAGVVGQMKDDPRIILPLINALGVVGGMYIPTTLAHIGMPALEAVLVKYDEPNVDLRLGILITLQEMFRLDSLNKRIHQTSTNLQAVQDILLRGIDDSNHFIRRRAVKVIGVLGDRSFADRLVFIAQNDPYYWSRNTDNQRKDWSQLRYPVRESAQEIIKSWE